MTAALVPAGSGACVNVGLADMLHDFDIAPMSIWPVPRMPDSKSRKGYLRRQFEAAWAAYCRSDDERPAQGFRVLRSA